MALYPTYKPLGVRRAWEHCAMGEGSSGQVLRKYGTPADWGDPVDAVAWFCNETDALKVLVADFANGRRVTLRRRSRDFQLEYRKAPAEQAA